MRKLEYRFGDKIGTHEGNRLTFLFKSEVRKGASYGFFLCECGNVKELRITSVTAKHAPVRSCGCLAKERAGQHFITHGLSKHPLANTYYDMCKRCYNTKRSDYKHYGGRGIKVCDRWLGENGLENFIFDMGNKPKGYELDRIDVNGNYEPANVQWADRSNQCFNRRKSDLNTSGKTGVYWHSQSNRWRAEITFEGRKIGLGNHRSYQDAVRVREDAEIKYFGYNPDKPKE